MNFDLSHLYMTTEGRIGRQSIWIGAVALAVIGIVINVIIELIFGWVSFAALLVWFIVQLALAYPAYALMAKRFQDRARSAIFAAAIVVIDILFSFLSAFGVIETRGMFDISQPVVTLNVPQMAVLAVIIWILVELGILRGTVGDNAYGPDPLQG